MPATAPLAARAAHSFGKWVGKGWNTMFPEAPVQGPSLPPSAPKLGKVGTAVHAAAKQPLENTVPVDVGLHMLGLPPIATGTARAARIVAPAFQPKAQPGAAPLQPEPEAVAALRDYFSKMMAGYEETVMAFDSSGTFNRTVSVVSGAADLAGRCRRQHQDPRRPHDTHDDDIANGLSQTITKDGRTTITANIPMNGKRITGLGNPDPASPQDAATKAYVDSVRTFATSLVISGADANGRLTFSSPTGSNGISWTTADLCWLAKLADPSKTGNRLVLNDTAAGTAGNDVVILDELGNLNLAGR